MRVFVTGASGFVGSHVTRQLVENGDEVAILLSPDSPAPRLHDVIDKVTVIRQRLADQLPIQTALQQFQPEACIHLAWYAEPGKYLDSPENIPLLQQSLNLLDMLIALGCGRVVMVGTCAEYDTDLGYLREDSPTKPATIYAACKLSLGLIGQHRAAAANIHFAWARLFYLYGLGEDSRRLIPALVEALQHGKTFDATLGEQVRDYLHVADVASALIILARQSASGVYNIASGIPITIRQLMETVGQLAGHPELIRFGALAYRAWEPMFICGDNRKLRAIGWSPRFSLQDGLKQLMRTSV
jgi:dTDP-6-deoxy-L-talose 4-dehydrogenase (NAD+)